MARHDNPVLSRPRLLALLAPFLLLGYAGIAFGPSPAAGVLVIAVALIVAAFVEKVARP